MHPFNSGKGDEKVAVVSTIKKYQCAATGLVSVWVANHVVAVVVEAARAEMKIVLMTEATVSAVGVIAVSIVGGASGMSGLKEIGFID